MSHYYTESFSLNHAYSLLGHLHKIDQEYIIIINNHGRIHNKKNISARAAEWFKSNITAGARL